MITFLDLLILVSMVLIAASFLSVVLMFLIKNKKVQWVCFCIAVVLSLYIGYVGVRVNWLDFAFQALLAAVMGIASVGSLVLAIIRKRDDRVFLYARIAVAAALVIGTVNALLV